MVRSAAFTTHLVFKILSLVETGHDPGPCLVHESAKKVTMLTGTIVPRSSGGGTSQPLSVLGSAHRYMWSTLNGRMEVVHVACSVRLLVQAAQLKTNLRSTEDRDDNFP